MNKPKILLYDIETLPNQGYFWDLWNGTNHRMVMNQKSIITIAYKFYGEEDVHLISALDFPANFRKDPYDDSEILKAFLPILEEADYTVAHYGDKFDNKVIAARLFFNDLPPIPTLSSIDTKKLVSRHFHINSSKLEYIAEQLGFGVKGDIGIVDWIKAAQGSKVAVKRMGKYNKQDVVLLEKIFIKLLPHTALANKLNHNLFTGEEGCPSCGSTNLQKRGYLYTKMTKRQRIACNACGAWHSKLITKSEIQAQMDELLSK